MLDLNVSVLFSISCWYYFKGRVRGIPELLSLSSFFSASWDSEGIVLQTWTKNFSHSVMIAQAIAVPAKGDDVQCHTSGCLAAPWDAQL